MTAPAATAAPLELAPADLAIYQRAQEGPFFFADPSAGALSLSGETRLDFLQRQSTNDLRFLPPTRALVTVLTSPTAKILDVLLLVDRGDSILMLPLPGRQSSTLQFLRSRIFFMDRVTVDEVSADWAWIGVGGQGWQQSLQSLGFTLADAPGAAARLAAQGQTATAVRVAERFPGQALILARGDAPAAVQQLLAEAGAVELTPAVHEVLRVEMGIPGPAAELTEDYSPLEAGLLDAVAEGKGCYTGQEVIARQLTYDKVVQRLLRLRLDGPVQAGDGLFVEGRRVGLVTSVVRSPREGLIALGYVRRPDFEAGSVLSLSPGEGGVQVTVLGLSGAAVKP